MKATETVSILTAETVTDRYGDTEQDWTDPVSRTAKAIVYPRTSEENNDKRTAVISGLTLLLDVDTTIAHDERVEVRGGVWEVDGDPGDWSAPWGWQPGQQVDLRRVEG